MKNQNNSVFGYSRQSHFQEMEDLRKLAETSEAARYRLWEINRYFRSQEKSLKYVRVNNSKKAVKVYNAVAKEHDAAMLVLDTLLTLMNNCNALEYTQEEIGKFMGIDRQTINAIFQILYKHKLLMRLKKDSGRFKKGTYFLNQRFFSKQSLHTLQLTEGVVPQEMRRNRTFQQYVEIDCHINTIRTLLAIFKNNHKAFTVYFLSALHLNKINEVSNIGDVKECCVVRRNKGKNVSSIKERTFKKIINFLIDNNLAVINSLGKLQLNIAVFWSPYFSWKNEEKMFNNDFAGVEHQRHLNSLKWFGLTEEGSKKSDNKVYNKSIIGELTSYFVNKKRANALNMAT